jgi:hypothetical protein
MRSAGPAGAVVVVTAGVVVVGAALEVGVDVLGDGDVDAGNDVVVGTERVAVVVDGGCAPSRPQPAPITKSTIATARMSATARSCNAQPATE